MSEFAQNEALKVAATLPPLLLFVWGWGTLISSPDIRRVFRYGSLAMIAIGYAYIAVRYWT